MQEEVFIKFKEAALASLPEFESSKKVAAAVSGGSDSMALALLLSELCRQQKIELIALIVSHRMRENSDLEAQKTTESLAKHKIDSRILYVEKSQLSESNVEANLRELRYRLLVDFCLQNQIPAIFLGHHLNDVAENFLIRLFRGSHLDGLSTIASARNLQGISLIRPLLNFSKQELQNFLLQKNVDWFEDESNLNEVFLRNKIRRFLNEFPDKNLLAKRIKSASDAIFESKKLLDEIAKNWETKIIFSANNQKAQLEDFQKFPKEFLTGIKKISAKNCFLSIQSSSVSLLEKSSKSGFFIDCNQLLLCPKQLALKILAEKLQQIGGKPYKPRFIKVENFYKFLTDETSHPPRYSQHQNHPRIYKIAGCQAFLMKSFCEISAEEISD